MSSWLYLSTREAVQQHCISQLEPCRTQIYGMFCSKHAFLTHLQIDSSNLQSGPKSGLCALLPPGTSGLDRTSAFHGNDRGAGGHTRPRDPSMALTQNRHYHFHINQKTWADPNVKRRKLALPSVRESLSRGKCMDTECRTGTSPLTQRHIPTNDH